MNLLRALMKNNFSKISLIFLVVLYTLILFADFFSPYHPNERDTKASYLPPSKIYLFYNGIPSKPYIYKTKQTFDPVTLTKTIKEDKSKKYYIDFLIRGNNYKFFGIKDKGTKIYLFGTDKNGRDIFSRIIHGGRPSLTIGFIGLIIVFPLGLIYGAIAGYYGGTIDNILMRIAEALMSLPYFYLIVVLASILPENISNAQRFLLITIILSFVSWAGLSRIIRGQVLSIKEEEFVQSAKAVGVSDLGIIIKHIIPQTMSYIVVAITLSIPGFIIGESALSFLGLGISQPDPSWGNILSEGKDLSNMLIRPWILFIPTFCIFSSVLCFNLLGDRIRDILDPKN